MRSAPEKRVRLRPALRILSDRPVFEAPSERQDGFDLFGPPGYRAGVDLAELSGWLFDFAPLTAGGVRLYIECGHDVYVDVPTDTVIELVAE